MSLWWLPVFWVTVSLLPVGEYRPAQLLDKAEHIEAELHENPAALPRNLLATS